MPVVEEVTISLDPPETEEPEMPTTLPDGSDKFHSLMEQSMASIGQLGQKSMADTNFVSKAQDLDYLEGKRLVSLEEAMGIREVASKSVPAGPVSG